MEAVLEDKPTGSCSPARPARSSRPSRPDRSVRQIAQAAWECADPGLQFDTTINHWHTAPNTGRINGQQPVLRVHAPRQLGVQPGEPQPAEVPGRGRHLRRRGVQGGGRGRLHRPGDPGRQRRLPDGEDRRDDAARSASSASATPTSAPCSWRSACPTTPTTAGPCAAAITALMTGHAYATSARIAGAHGPVRRLLRERRADGRGAAHAPVRGGQDRRGACPDGAALGGPGGLGLGGRARRGLRRAQLPGDRARPDGHDRVPDGLRHDRHRARPRPREDEEAGRRRDDVDRQPDGSPRAAPPRLRRRPGRRDRRTTSTSTSRSSARRTCGPSTSRSSPARWATTPSTTSGT